MRQVLEYLEDTLVSGPQLQNVRLLKVGTTCCTMMVHRISLNHPSICSCLISYHRQPYFPPCAHARMISGWGDYTRMRTRGEIRRD